MTVQIAFDPAEAPANAAKHKVSFAHAEQALRDPPAVTIPLPRRGTQVEVKGINTMRKQYDLSKGKRGAVNPSPGKTRITIMLDDDIIEHFRSEAEANGIGYQTMINGALRRVLGKSQGGVSDEKPVTVATLRKVLREELREASS
jgi:uncharacterized protein (DUF4415 family)